MKTFRMKIVDGDGNPAAVEVTGAESPGEAVRKARRLLAPTAEILAFEEIGPGDEGGTEAP